MLPSLFFLGIALNIWDLLWIHMNFYICKKCKKMGPASVAPLVGASSHAPKGHRFHSWSGHTPRLQVWFPVEACAGGKPMDVSLTSMFLSLPLCLSGINKCIYFVNVIGILIGLHLLCRWLWGVQTLLQC